ncbi:MAG: AAA family ATPase [Gemmataceae bacterium]|nr:AAA family ATPase [Gemmataceae bacterium]
MTHDFSTWENPFVHHKVDDTLTVPPGDVSYLHADIVARCCQIIEQARQSQSSQSLLVVGEAGSGKSHLLAKLRQRLRSRDDIVVLGIRLGGIYAGRLWRQIRERFVEELLHPYPPQDGGGHGLLRILKNRFPDWQHDARQRLGNFIGIFNPSARIPSIEKSLDEFSQICPLDPALRSMLPKLFDESQATAARDWLQGKMLSEEDSQRLGIDDNSPDEEDEEYAAEQIVRSLLRLAGYPATHKGKPTVLVLCFDEVEGLQTHSEESFVLRRFASIVTDVLAESGPRAVITFVRPRIWEERFKRAIEVSHQQKLAQQVEQIPPLNGDQARRVVEARLAAWKGKPFGSDPYFPIGRDFVDSLYQKHRYNLTPRLLIMACQDEFEYRRRVLDSVGDGLPLGRSPSNLLEGLLLNLWEDRCEQFTRRLGDLPFDSVLGVSLPWLAGHCQGAFVLCDDLPRPMGDINFVFRKRRAAATLGISFCNHPPRSLWRRLDRLLKQWEKHRDRLLSELILLRLKITRTTEQGQLRLDRLASAGVRIIYLENQQFVELAAYQDLLTAAHQGDLTYPDGRLIDETSFSKWAQQQLSPSVKELVDALFGSTQPAEISPVALPTSQGLTSA